MWSRARLVSSVEYYCSYNCLDKGRRLSTSLKYHDISSGLVLLNEMTYSDDNLNFDLVVLCIIHQLCRGKNLASCNHILHFWLSGCLCLVVSSTISCHEVSCTVDESFHNQSLSFLHQLTLLPLICRTESALKFGWFFLFYLVKLF